MVSLPLTIAIDAMGGDAAPDMVIDGVSLAHVRFPHVRFALYGDSGRIAALLQKYSAGVQSACSICHADDVVSNDAKPGQVLRTGRKTSMWLAVDSVSQGQAAGIVSAGNTGALMAVSKFVLRTLPGIDRPAIASMLPTRRGQTVVLDLGANVDCNANNLVEFAVMGEVFARNVLGLDRPSVALLNVGSEEMKGNDAVKAAAAQLRSSHLPIQFHGFVEGDDIAAGTVDVIVCDGFTGNITLKAIEGMAKLYTSLLKGAFQSSFLAKLGFLFASHSLSKLKARTDPRRYNGAMFLGLNGTVVKSHGGTDAFGFANAVGVAIELVSHGFNDRIRQEMEELRETSTSCTAKEE